MKLILANETEFERVWHCAWSNSHKLLAVSGNDTFVEVFETNLGDEPSLKKIDAPEQLHTKTIRCVEFSQDGKFIATGSFDSTINVYFIHAKEKPILKFELVATLEGHENEIKSLAWSTDSKVLASSSRDKSIWLWEVQDPEDEDIEVLDDWDCISVLHGHSQDVKFVKFFPSQLSDQETLFSCGYDDSIKVWDYDSDTGEYSCSFTLDAHASTIWQLDIFLFQNKTYLLSCSQDNSVILRKFDYTDGRYSVSEVAQIIHHNRSVFSIDSKVEENSVSIVTGSRDNSVGYFSFDGTTIQTNEVIVEAHEADVNCVRWDPSGKFVCSVGDDSMIKIWGV